MRNILILILVSTLPSILIGCDSTGSNNDASTEADDETKNEIEGRYQLVSTDLETVPFLMLEEDVEVPQTGQPAHCKTWFLEDAWIFTFQKTGSIVAKRIESIECTTLESPIYTYGGKLKSERTGRYSRAGKDITVLWNGYLPWTGEVKANVITFSIPIYDTGINATAANFRKE
jgi:hypothetical protein